MSETEATTLAALFHIKCARRSILELPAAEKIGIDPGEIAMVKTVMALWEDSLARCLVIRNPGKVVPIR